MKLDIVRDRARVTWLHPSHAVGVRLREIGVEAAKGRRQARAQSLADRNCRRVAIMVVDKQQHSRPPAMIGRALRVESQHVGTRTNQGGSVSQPGKIGCYDRRYSLMVVGSIQFPTGYEAHFNLRLERPVFAVAKFGRVGPVLFNLFGCPMSLTTSELLGYQASNSFKPVSSL